MDKYVEKTKSEFKASRVLKTLLRERGEGMND